MTGDSEEALISIAKAVADGSPADWEQVSEGRLDDAGKLRSLKGIAEVAAAWQTINKQAGGGANTGGADETLASGPRLDDSRSSPRPASWGPLQILERVGRGCVGERAPAGDSDQSGNVYGTPLYMAPEQLAGAGPSAAADIYSLGVLLYHLTTGAYPVEAGSTNELTDKHAQGDSMPLRDRRPELPAAFIQVVERAVSPRPEGRYPSAGVMERALTATAGGGAPAPPAHPV